MATAGMDQSAGKICDLTSSFEWTVPRTLLQNTDVAAKSPVHSFCGAKWNVWMFRNNSGTCFFLRKEPTDRAHINHDGYAIIANLRARVDGKEYPLHTAKPVFFEALQASQYFISSEKCILWKHLKGDMKIFCILKLRDFKEELEEIPSKNSQAASAVLSRRDASTETVQKDLSKTVAEKPDENDNAVTRAGTWQTRISQLFGTKEKADVRIVVNGRIFEAHRFALAMRSPEFSRILIGANESVYTHIVDSESVTEAAFDILLRFLYTDTLGTTDKQSIIETYLCAIAYRVTDLRDQCKEEMEAWDITTEEIFSLMDFGLDVPTLRDKCMRLLQTKGRVALSHPAFLKISSKCLRYVLEGGVLENVPVLERIERIIEWCVQPHAEGANYVDVRNKLLDNKLLGRLEFEKLELQELTLMLNKYQGLITPEELMCFLKYKHTKDSSVLPDWCLAESKAAS